MTTFSNLIFKKAHIIMTQFAIFDSKGDRTLGEPAETKAEAIKSFVDLITTKDLSDPHKIWNMCLELGYSCREL